MDLTLDTDDQDRIINLCILDSTFLGQIIRQKVEPRHFGSDVRQKVFKTICEFYKAYGKAPREDIISEIESKMRRKKIHEDDREVYEQYLLDVCSIPEFSSKRITDRLEFFVKTRIVNTLCNDLLRLQDRFEIDPDRPLNLIREAMADANRSIGRQSALSILDDSEDGLYNSDFVTKFGIDPIDRQLGGGLKRGNYVIIQGFTGMGKSWIVNHLAKWAVRFGHSPLVIPTEMSNRTARLRFRMSFTGKNAQEISENPGEVRDQIARSMNKGADIFLIPEEEKSMRVDELPSLIEDVETKNGKEIKLILFDSADELLPPEKRYKNEIESNTAIHTYLKNYAREEDKCVISTAQCQRIGETKVWLGAANVGENINKIRKATVAISINGVPEEKKRWHYRLWLFKNTDGDEGAKVWARRDFKRGQLLTRYGPWPGMKRYKEMYEREPILDNVGENDEE